MSKNPMVILGELQKSFLPIKKKVSEGQPSPLNIWALWQSGKMEAFSQ